MNQNDYYIAPSDNVFTEIKRCALIYWSQQPDPYRHVEQKISEVIRMENIRDNCDYLVQMVDPKDHEYLLLFVQSDEARVWLTEFIAKKQDKKNERL